MENEAIERAKEHFGGLLERQMERVAAMKESSDFVDYGALDTIKIGLIGGDGIGPAITETARGVLARLLDDAVASGKIEFRNIEGLTIENRAAHLQSIPDDVLAEIKECDVTLKGPTTTPEKGDGWPNLESANVGMRKELDLFANVGRCGCRRRGSTGCSSGRIRRIFTRWVPTGSMLRRISRSIFG